MNFITATIENICGDLCKLLLPIRTQFAEGEGKTIAICTLSSLDLMEKISKDQILMRKIVLVGRLLSENKGIDRIIRYSQHNKLLAHIVLCGTDTNGHLAGNSLLSLIDKGIDEEGRILNSIGHRPYLTASHEDVERFRKRVSIHNLLGIVDIEFIRNYVDFISS
jgi:tetrahydromethanopterin S-methyltransferase subunit A